MQDRKVLYVMGWCLLGGGVLFLLLEKGTGFSLRPLWPPCLFHLLTGYYCPGCGGTRAALALVHGQILDSVRYHPVVPYGAFLFLWFMSGTTYHLLVRGKWKEGVLFRKRYVVIALLLLAAHFFIVNGTLFFKGVDLLA